MKDSKVGSICCSASARVMRGARSRPNASATAIEVLSHFQRRIVGRVNHAPRPPMRGETHEDRGQIVGVDVVGVDVVGVGKAGVRFASRASGSRLLA